MSNETFSGQPVGVAQSDELSIGHERGYLSLTFYSAGVPVTPTEGSVLVEVSADNLTWRNVLNGAIDAANQGAFPMFEGPAVYVRLAFAGIVGADWFSATVYRYDR